MTEILRISKCCVRPVCIRYQRWIPSTWKLGQELVTLGHASSWSLFKAESASTMLL